MCRGVRRPKNRSKAGGHGNAFFCDFKFCKLCQKMLLLLKLKYGEMRLTGGRWDLSGQLLLVVHLNLTNFALCKNSAE